MLISVLIPVFSETRSLERTVRILGEALDGLPYEILLLVHKDSAVECFRTCEELARASNAVRVQIQQRYPGQGWAYREGFDAALGTYILMMNADLETEPRDARRLADAIAGSDVDLVVASRWMKGGSIDIAGYGAMRLACSWAFQRLIGGLARTRVHDLTFAFKIGTTRLFRSFEWEGTGHELAMETTLRPILAGWRVIEIPTTWIGRDEGLSHHRYSRNLRHLKLAAALLARRARGITDATRGHG
jgi:dolichol-phosphate mannosyltransferase